MPLEAFTTLSKILADEILPEVLTLTLTLPLTLTLTLTLPLTLTLTLTLPLPLTLTLTRCACTTRGPSWRGAWRSRSGTRTRPPCAPSASASTAP